MDKHGSTEEEFMAALPPLPKGWIMSPKSNPSWLQVVDVFGDEQVIIRWDGCAHITQSWGNEDLTGPDAEYIHLCNLRHWLNRMQELCDWAIANGIYTEIG